MRSRIIIAIFGLCVAINAHAQLGIVGGLTSSSADIKSAYSDLTSKSINQYHVGLTCKFALGKLFAIQPSLIYNVKGSTLEDISGISDVNMKTGYLELPIQLQAGISFGKVARIYGIAEPFIGYAITNEVSWEGVKNTNWDDVKNRLEYGLGLGAGTELFKHLQISIRYFWNLGTIYGNQIKIKDIPNTISDTNCNGISLSAAFLF